MSENELKKLDGIVGKVVAGNPADEKAMIAAILAEAAKEGIDLTEEKLRGIFAEAEAIDAKAADEAKGRPLDAKELAALTGGYYAHCGQDASDADWCLASHSCYWILMHNYEGEYTEPCFNEYACIFLAGAQ